MKLRFSKNSKITILIFFIFFTVYLFSSDAHRYSFDEDTSAQQSLWLATLTPHPDFVLGESKTYFNYPELWPSEATQRFATCTHELLCSSTAIGHSITQIPFIWINQTFGVFQDSNFWDTSDFDHAHYVWWRNSINPDFTFMELFYGPLFSALSVTVFYLILRSFNFTQKNSILVTFLFGLSTIVWAYSQTTLNVVPQLLFVLLSYLFFKRFQKSQSAKDVIFTSASLGFTFLIRPDGILIIIILSIFTFLLIKQSKSKLNYIWYMIPVSSFVFLFDYIEFIRKGSFLIARSAEKSFNHLQLVVSDVKTSVIVESQVVAPVLIYSPLEAFFGLLFSPGVGLFIFSPILFLSLFTFTDFYKNHKKETFLFIGVIGTFLLYYSFIMTNTWHGLVGWSARYLILLIPFLLIPLAATLEKRTNKIFLSIILFLGSLGVLFNLVWLVQDVSWFVWAGMGESKYGLYSLPSLGWSFRISPLVLWTFEFSQLTNSIFLAFTHLQLDIFLVKLLTPIGYIISFVGILGSLLFSLFRLLRNELRVAA